MARNWAIVIGINQYRFLQPLKYAKRDAEMMCRFLTEEARFDRIFLFTDNSPPIGDKPTEPFRANLLRVLRQFFEVKEPVMEKPLKDGDNVWFFFSGHGIPHNGQDYLLPLDGDPEDIENTGIPTNIITNYLRGYGADNAVMILDACRSGGKKSGEGIGRQTEAEARQTGVISLFSCSPKQYSYELETLRQGAFTYALLEGLGIRGRCATVERLNQYLEHRVPELVSQHSQGARQTPYTIAEPLNRSHLILMPQHANLADIATLKNDAYRAQMSQNWNLAQQLWIRVNSAASGQDIEAIEALQNLGVQRYTNPVLSELEPPQISNPKSQPFTSNQLNQPPRSSSLTRQQFLKWAVPTGIGVVGVSLSSKLLGLSPQSSSLPPPSVIVPERLPVKPTLSPSATPIDYSSLERFLREEKWEDADQETSSLMLKVANRKQAGWLDSISLGDFPCEVLSKIDHLWRDSSDGRFGFSVQNKIYLECVSKSDGNYDEAAWYCFGDLVGWRVKSQWISYSGVTFSKLAPRGHLPIVPTTEIRFAHPAPNHYMLDLLKRVVSCRITESFKLMG